MLAHLQKPFTGRPRPEFGPEAGEAMDAPGGEGGLLVGLLVISIVFVALATAALFS